MILTTIITIPIIGVLILLMYKSTVTEIEPVNINDEVTNNKENYSYLFRLMKRLKMISIMGGILNFMLMIVMFILFNANSKQYQFMQENYNIKLISREIPFDICVGTDGLSINFLMLTGIIIPLAIVSNWKSIKENIRSYVVIILLLSTLLLTVFLVLDTLFFYIFFESILPPLFILIGLFGAKNKVRASFYLFLYTLLGSLFLLLSILFMSSEIGVGEYTAVYKNFFIIGAQIFIFIGIFIAFAVKTPTIFLNIWLLKAHVESPLGGSIILAAIVLKLSLYGIMKLILPIVPDATYIFTAIVYGIAAITILYASVSTLRTTDIKELIAYSSVSHAAVYILGVFSNIIIGIQGAIILGLAHGFVSSGLFTVGGGVLYDRSGTRLISCFRGMTQLMPIFSVLFFILCLGNSGTPLTLNFIGEFMSLYGAFEQLPIIGAIACSSIVFSAAYTIYMYNRISFGGSFSRYFKVSFSDVNKREFIILSILVFFTVILGIYPAPILDSISFSVSSLIYNSKLNDIFFYIGLFITLKPNNSFNHARNFSATNIYFRIPYNRPERTIPQNSPTPTITPQENNVQEIYNNNVQLLETTIQNLNLRINNAIDPTEYNNLVEQRYNIYNVISEHLNDILHVRTEYPDNIEAAQEVGHQIETLILMYGDGGVTERHNYVSTLPEDMRRLTVPDRTESNQNNSDTDSEYTDSVYSDNNSNTHNSNSNIENNNYSVNSENINTNTVNTQPSVNDNTSLSSTENNSNTQPQNTFNENERFTENKNIESNSTTTPRTESNIDSSFTKKRKFSDLEESESESSKKRRRDSDDSDTEILFNKKSKGDNIKQECQPSSSKDDITKQESDTNIDSKNEIIDISDDDSNNNSGSSNSGSIGPNPGNSGPPESSSGDIGSNTNMRNVDYITDLIDSNILTYDNVIDNQYWYITEHYNIFF